MMERIPVGTFVLERNPSGSAAFTFLSSGLLAMVNANRNSVLTDPDAIFSSVHPDDLERVREGVLRSMASGNRSKQEYRIIRPNGEIRHVSAISIAARGPNGEPLKLTGVCFDITNRKLAKIKLKQSETRLARIIDEVPIPILVCSTQKFGTILSTNKALFSTFGYSPEELPDLRAWSILAYPDEAFRNYVFERWNASTALDLDHDGMVGPLEYPILCKDGSIRDVTFSGVIVDDIITVTAVDRHRTPRPRPQQLLPRKFPPPHHQTRRRRRRPLHRRHNHRKPWRLLQYRPLPSRRRRIPPLLPSPIMGLPLPLLIRRYSGIQKYSEILIESLPVHRQDIPSTASFLAVALRD